MLLNDHLDYGVHTPYTEGMVQKTSLKETASSQAIKPKKPWSDKIRMLIGLGLIASIILLLVGGSYGMSYANTPEHIRRPKDEHAHLRLQVIVDGRPENFAETPYQQSYDDGFCSDKISDEPFHFHDNLDQMLHVHWQNMTGGGLLKYYGWNLIGGASDNLGYRYDKGLFKRQKVAIHGQNLPAPHEGFQYFVYTGDEKVHERRSWDNFLYQDFETFLGRQSSIPDALESSSSFFSTQVYAHGAVDDGHQTDDKKNDIPLERLQNLLGNIIIFAQVSEPSAAEVQERFDKLLPLTESTCAG